MEIEFLYAALNAEIGVIVNSSNVDLTKARMYKLIKENPELSGLSLLTSPVSPSTEIYVVRKEVPVVP